LDFDISNKDKLFILGLAALDNVDRNLSSEENRVKNAGIMDNTQNQFISGINYRRLVNNGYFDFTFNYNRYDYDFSQIDEFGEKYFDSNAIENEFGIKAQYFHAFSKKVGLLSGISSKLIDIDNKTAFADTIYNSSGNRVPVESIGVQQYTDVVADGNKYAAFVKMDWAITPLLSLNLGLRLDYYNFLSDPAYISPRFNLRYKLSNKISVKGSLGIYYQSPSYVWMVNDFNRDLKALRNDMAILGLDYLIQDDLRMSVETFYKDYSDLPTGTTRDVNDYIVITNTGTTYGGREDDFQSFGYFPMVSTAYGNAYGFELLFQKKFSEVPCYGQVSFAYSNSRLTAGNGKTYPGQFDQRFIFNLAGGYKFNENWEVSSKYRYFTGVPYTPVYRPDDNPINPGQTQNLPDEYFSERLNAEGIWDVRVDRYFNFKSWRLTIFLDIQNVLNTKYQVKPRYDFWADEIVTTNSIGILPSIGISGEF
jgi:hypothetical protein